MPDQRRQRTQRTVDAARARAVSGSAGRLSADDIEGLSRTLRRSLDRVPTPTFTELCHLTAPGVLSAHLRGTLRPLRPASAPLRRPLPGPSDGPCDGPDAELDFLSTMARMKRDGSPPRPSSAAPTSPTERIQAQLSPSDLDVGATIGVAPAVSPSVRRRSTAIAAAPVELVARVDTAPGPKAVSGDDDDDAFFNLAAPRRTIDQYLRRRKTSRYGRYAAAAAELQRRTSRQADAYYVHPAEAGADPVVRRYLRAGGGVAATQHRRYVSASHAGLTPPGPH